VLSTLKSKLVSLMISPPTPIPKSNQRFLKEFTLKEGFFSFLRGDLYQ